MTEEIFLMLCLDSMSELGKRGFKPQDYHFFENLGKHFTTLSLIFLIVKMRIILYTLQDALKVTGS